MGLSVGNVVGVGVEGGLLVGVGVGVGTVVGVGVGEVGVGVGVGITVGVGVGEVGVGVGETVGVGLGFGVGVGEGVGDGVGEGVGEGVGVGFGVSVGFGVGVGEAVGVGVGPYRSRRVERNLHYEMRRFRKRRFHMFPEVSSNTSTALPIISKSMFTMHPKKISTWIIVSTLVLISTSSLAFSSTFSIQNGTSEIDKASSIFSILEEANATTVKLFNQLEAKGVTAPEESILRYNEALLLASEAESMIQLGEYSEASATCIEAIQKLKESLRIIYGSVTEQPSEFEANIEKTIALNSAIDRFHEQLLRIENLTSIAKNNGFNTTELETKTQTVKSLLAEASDKIEEGKLEVASENLSEAKALISNLSDNLNELAIELKVQRLSTYIEETQVRLEALKTRAISISNTASLTYVNQAEDSLSNAKEYLEQQLINQTLTELANSKDNELQAEKILNPTSDSTSSVTSRSPTVTATP